MNTCEQTAGACTHHRNFLIAALAFAALAPAASAQGVTIWGESGYVTDKFGNGTAFSGSEIGGGASFIIGGHSEKNTAFLFPVGVEVRASPESKEHSTDILSYGDFAIRIKHVSFGPGMNFGYIFRPDVPDSRCAAETQKYPAYTVPSCTATGDRTIGTILGLGLSGFGKVSFGPQGRAFVQGRYIYYAKELTAIKYPADFAAAAGVAATSPNDTPDFQNGQDIRLSAGYVFGKVIVRGQYSLRKFDFTNTFMNSNGIWNQRTNMITAGIGYAF